MQRTMQVLRSGGVWQGIAKPSKHPSHDPILSKDLHRLVHTTSSSHEYVIVGGGTAGCVLANRLSAPVGGQSTSTSTVHLLEAGPTDRGLYRLTFDIPLAFPYNMFNKRFNWSEYTIPQKHLNNRAIYWVRGRVLGGGSSLNGMIYIRGHPMDYDRWEREGATGWNFASCLPYFRRSQTHEFGPDAYRGVDGPLFVSRGKTNHPLHHAWLEAGQEAGYPFTEDLNGFQQEGVGYFDLTVKDGRRCSTSGAYLHPIRNERSNLTVTTDAFATRIIFDGHRAVAVEYTREGQVHRALAEREVILCGGAINSPQLLMLSGIGDCDHLRSVGIDGWHSLPGVGANLQDHVQLSVRNGCTRSDTLKNVDWRSLRCLSGIALDWILFKRGWAATSHVETGAFIRSDSNVPHPDIQFLFFPANIYDNNLHKSGQHAFQVQAIPLRPTSSGHVSLKSANPHETPIIDPNYMATEQDRKDMRASIRLSRGIFAQPTLAERYGGVQQMPGPEYQTDAQLDQFWSAFAESSYHPSGTCRMGSNPDGRERTQDDAGSLGHSPAGERVEAAVTCPDCTVWGLEGLRVVDASIMPSLISGNPNGPVVMMAERAADMILSSRDGRDHMLPPTPKVAVWYPEKPNCQRDGEPTVEVPAPET